MILWLPFGAAYVTVYFFIAMAVREDNKVRNGKQNYVQVLPSEKSS
jgi:hypothetical protein